MRIQENDGRTTVEQDRQHGNDWLWWLVRVLGIGFVLNVAWEMAQMNAYTDGNGQPFSANLGTATVACLVASLGDITVVGVTYGAGWVIHRRSSWICMLRWRDALMIGAGLVVVAVVIELISVNIFHLWGYAGTMPLVPVLHVGLLPAIQLAFLTLLTFAIVGRLARQPSPST